MKIQAYRTIAEIPSHLWQTLSPREFPFASFEFLSALENHQCLGVRTGWEPRLLCAWQDTQLLGLAILFEKTNSYGEYIFDFGWADAHERYGLEYYPKLVAAIPFTPATGSKILVAHSLPPEEKLKVVTFLIEAVIEFYQKSECSSIHALFIDNRELTHFADAGFFSRHSFQFHWTNHGYKSFSDFTDKLRSKRRREIYRERTQATVSGIRIERLTGKNLRPEHAEWMYGFYLSTVQKMGGFAYLTKGFFQEVFRTMSEKILFVLATTSDGIPVAGALNFFGERTLFGRHWGCLDEYKALHFEVCYYQGIEFAIERGFTLFEAGAQGEHKFQRGFLPTLTYSAHKIKDSRMNAAVQDFTVREKHEIEILFEEYTQNSPFQRG